MEPEWMGCSIIRAVGARSAKHRHDWKQWQRDATRGLFPGPSASPESTRGRHRQDHHRPRHLLWPGHFVVFRKAERGRLRTGVRARVGSVYTLARTVRFLARQLPGTVPGRSPSTGSWRAGAPTRPKRSSMCRRCLTPATVQFTRNDHRAVHRVSGLRRWGRCHSDAATVTGTVLLRNCGLTELMRSHISRTTFLAETGAVRSCRTISACADGPFRVMTYWS
jgi:hypothetical protein